MDSGSPLDTSTTGQHAFVVDAADTAGNTAQASHAYTVNAV